MLEGVVKVFELKDFDKKVRRRAWLQTAGIPKNRFGWTLADCVDTSKTVLEAISEWFEAVREGQIVQAIKDPDCGRGILFYGEPGRGKTTLALAIIQEMMTEFPLEAFGSTNNGVLVRPCYFSTFNGVLDLKGRLMEEHTEAEETLYLGMLGDCRDPAYNIRVLIIDDVGKEHTSLSGWQKNMLHHVLRTRFNNGLPTIVTSNISRDNWAASYGDATGSFIKEAFLYIPVIGNKDLR